MQISARTETVLAKLKEIINSSVEAVEEKIAQVLEVHSVMGVLLHQFIYFSMQVLSGHSRDVEHYASEKVDDGAHAWSRGSDKVDKVREKAEGADEPAQEKGDGAIKRATQWVKGKVQGTGDEL